MHHTPSGNGDNAGTPTATTDHLNHGSFSVGAQVNFDQLGLVGTPVFYSFTTANGAASDGHFVTSAMAVPEPGQPGHDPGGAGLPGADHPAAQHGLIGTRPRPESTTA